jgi:hypothetical protein
VAQFYPEKDGDTERLAAEARAAGLTPCHVVDNVHQTAAKRHFLVLGKVHGGCGNGDHCV